MATIPSDAFKRNAVCIAQPGRLTGTPDPNETGAGSGRCSSTTTQPYGAGTFQGRHAKRSGGTMFGPRMDDPDLPLVLLFSHWPAATAAFLSHRMICFGCPISPFHTVIDACAEYGLDEALFRAELRAAVAVSPLSYAAPAGV